VESGPVSPADFGNEDMVWGKNVLIFFDDSTISPSNIKSTRDSAATFVKEHMRPNDLIAVASFGLSLKILQSFTNDQAKVLEAISQPAMSRAESIPQHNSPIERMQRTQQYPGDQNEYDPSIVKFLIHRSENLLRTLNNLSRSIRQLKGRKSIVIYSESGYFNETLHRIYQDTLDSARTANVVFYTVDSSGLTSGFVGEIQKPSTDRSAASPTKSASNGFISGRLLPVLGRNEPWNRHLLSSSFFQQGKGGQSGGQNSGGGGQGGSGSSGGGGANTGGTAGNSGSSRTDRGTNSTRTNNIWGNDPGGNFMPNPFSMTRLQQNLLRSLAEETGGWSIYNTNAFDKELDKLDRQISNYYILGFHPNNPKRDGSFRKLKVKTDVKDVKLRHREGYIDKRPLDTLADSKQERSLLDAMASPAPATKLPLTFRSAYFYDSPNLAKVVISVRIGTEKMKLKKKGSELRGDLNIMGVAYAENGTVAARFSETLHLSFDKEEEEQFRKITLSYRNYFRLRPGEYRLKLAVSDEARNLGSAERFLPLPVLPERKLAGSSLVLAEQTSALPQLIQNLNSKLLDDSNPLIYAGMQIFPSVENRLPVDAPFPVFFKLYNLAAGSEPSKLMVKAKLLRDNGEEESLPWLSLGQNVYRTGNMEAAVGINLTFGNIQPGKYKLVVETSEPDKTASTIVQTDVEIVGN
jgi:mRNA-degrading endonuclease RelE of RelBE toxin-antitoxin system